MDDTSDVLITSSTLNVEAGYIEALETAATNRENKNYSGKMCELCIHAIIIISLQHKIHSTINKVREILFFLNITNGLNIVRSLMV